ncbi:MAG: polysaccharide deacetylase family protein [Saccharofermentanales bacterium]
MSEKSLFPGNKRFAVTFSYDDGTVHDKRLVDILNENGMKGTFHINSGRLGSAGFLKPEELRSLFAGHEISSHTVGHYDLTKVSEDIIRDEIIKDKANLENICGYPIRSMSYPYGTYNDRVIRTAQECGIEYSRCVNSTGSFGIPDDFMVWRPSCHHRDALITVNSFLRLLSDPGATGLLYIWGHSFEFERNENWSLIEEICTLLRCHEDICYATGIELFDFLK